MITLKRVLYVLVISSVIVSSNVVPCKGSSTEAEIIEVTKVDEIVENGSPETILEENLEEIDEQSDEIINCEVKESVSPYLAGGGRLTEDTEIKGDFYLKKGDLILDGNVLTIKGNFYHIGGNLNLSGGKLIIEGDYSITGDATLYMVSEKDYMLIMGNYDNETSTSHNGRLSKGILEIRGNYRTIAGNEERGENFYATGTHKVTLSGEQCQVISMEGYKNRFNILELRNTSQEGIIFVNPLIAKEFKDNECSYTLPDGQEKGWTLGANQTYEGDLYLGSGVLDLKGYNLTVTGNFYQLGGMVQINQGQLEVKGDLSISNYAQFEMKDEQDSVSVQGNFIIATEVSHIDKWKAGTLRVKGDFIQQNGSLTNLYASDKHFIILDGERIQNIYLASSKAKINILILTKPKDTGYIFNRVNSWNNLIEPQDDQNPPIMPQELTIISQSNDLVELTWEEATDDRGVRGYSIYRNEKFIGSTTETCYRDINLTPGEYTYFVSAYDINGNQSNRSNEVFYEYIEPKVINPPILIPGIEQINVTYEDDGSVSLRWEQPDDGEARTGYYKIYRSLEREKGYVVIAQVQVGVIPKYIDHEVVEDKTYYYYLTMINEQGEEGGPSTIISISTHVRTNHDDDGREDTDNEEESKEEVDGGGNGSGNIGNQEENKGEVDHGGNGSQNIGNKEENKVGENNESNESVDNDDKQDIDTQKDDKGSGQSNANTEENKYFYILNESDKEEEVQLKEQFILQEKRVIHVSFSDYFWLQHMFHLTQKNINIVNCGIFKEAYPLQIQNK